MRGIQQRKWPSVELEFGEGYATAALDQFSVGAAMSWSASKGLCISAH
jgi:hypothetical protein